MVAPRLITASRYNNRARNWARNYMIRGMQDRFGVMASPPTFTKGTTDTSSVNPGIGANTVQFNGQDDRLSWLGGPYLTATTLGVPTRYLENQTISTGAKIGTGMARIRFMTDAEAVDFAFQEGVALDINVIVDGQMAQRSRPLGFANSGLMRWVKFDLGTNAVTYALDQAPSITSGGAGHAVDDVITLDGGGGGATGTAAKVRVAAVSGGVITAISPELAGAYSAQLTGTVSQASTTGVGVGATFSATRQAPRNSTRRLRTIELLIRNSSKRFLGIALPEGRTLLPAPALTNAPSLLFIGDSITDDTYPAYAGYSVASTISQRLGLHDRHSQQTKGGTGWNKDNIAGNQGLAWASAERIADVVAEAPDIAVYIGSQNDTAGTALETAMGAALTTLQAALPDTLFVGIGNIMGDVTALSTSIAAGWALAPDQTRVRYLNNQSPKWIPSAFISQWAEVGDANHPHADGVDWFSTLAATQIGTAICEMALP